MSFVISSWTRVSKRRWRPLAGVLAALMLMAGCGGTGGDPAPTAVESVLEAAQSGDIDGVEAQLEELQESLQETARASGVTWTIGTGTLEVRLEDGTTVRVDGECDIYRDDFEDTVDFSETEGASSLYIRVEKADSGEPQTYGNLVGDELTVFLEPADATFDGGNAVSGGGTGVTTTTDGTPNTQSVTWNVTCRES